jgi:hypothetical protein
VVVAVECECGERMRLRRARDLVFDYDGLEERLQILAAGGTLWACFWCSAWMPTAAPGKPLNSCPGTESRADR